jgi:TonB family protein
MKKLIPALLAVLFPLISFAQNKARIVFFRIDAPYDRHSSAPQAMGGDDEKIFRNASPIGALKHHGVFVYDGEDTKGTYFIDPATLDVSEYRKLTICSSPNTIAFVLVSLSGNVPVVSYASMMDVVDFESCYKSNRWLKKALAAAGYKSFRELTDGFTPFKMRSIPVPALRAGLTDTVYTDSTGAQTDSAHAASYSVFRYENEHYYGVEKYHVGSADLRTKGHYSVGDSVFQEGAFENYYSNGMVSSKGSYSHGKETGEWEYFYDMPGGPLYYKERYEKNRIARTCYYPDGKLKRKEVQVIFGRIDTVIEGVCYNEEGKEIPFTPLSVRPRSPYDLNAYLGKNLRYPEDAREDNIEGRALVKFVIDKEGNVLSPRIVKRVSLSIDGEALKVVSQMPPWTPGRSDDQPVEVYFHLPIRFKLE